MQQEELIKRLRLYAGIITTAFVVMIVTLVVQFGFIAHYHQEIKDLRHNNEVLQEQIEAIEYQIAYTENSNQESNH